MNYEFLLQHRWTATALVALAAVIGAFAFHRVGGMLLRRGTRFSPVLSSVVAACEQAAGAVLPLFALQVVWQAADNGLRFIDNVRHVNGLLLIAALTWLVMAAVGGVATGVIAQHRADVADNLRARSVHTQAQVLARTASFIVLLVGIAMMLMTFPGARQVGASLLASAGVVGLVAGIAARPVFSNLISGLQIALAQPIRIDDVLIVKGEWGRVEEITGTYVVLKIWDERRLVIPLQWFIENPFENWTRTNSQLLGTVFLWLDFATPVDAIRGELARILETAQDWDGRVSTVVVHDASDKAMQIRILVSAPSAGQAFDLRCLVREKMISFLREKHPQSLPRLRIDSDPSGTDSQPTAALGEMRTRP